MTKVFIEQLNLISFSKFENKTIKFKDSFNLIYGLNESGKSSITSFVEGILYGFDKGDKKRNFTYKKEQYRPINSFKYAGSAIFNKDNIRYRVYRNFDDGSYEIYDINNSKKIEDKKSNLNFPGEFLLGIDYDTFISFLINFQNQDDHIINKNKIIEKLVSQDIDFDFSYTKAIDILENEKKSLGTDRAYTKPLAKLKEDIRYLDEKLDNIRNLKKNYKDDLLNLGIDKNNLNNYEKLYTDNKKRLDLAKATRANENYMNYKKWSDQLYLLKADEQKYDHVKGLDDAYFDNYKFEDKKNNYIPIYLFIASVIIVISIIFSKYFLFLLIALTLYVYTKNANQSKESFNNNYNQYNKKRADYLKYKEIIKEKQRIIDILDILEKQDLNYDIKSDYDISSIENIDIEKEEKKLEEINEKIVKLKDEIVDKEKNLLLVEDIIKNEVDYMDELVYKKNKLDLVQERIKAIEEAIEVIDEIISKSKENKLNFDKKIERILGEITLNDQIKIFTDKNLDLKLYKEDKEIGLSNLSTGFFDQLAFSYKFNLNKDIFDGLFMILDDAFINYDISRLRRALFFLLDLSIERQVIYFTCHNREEGILKAESIDINYIYLED